MPLQSFLDYLLLEKNYSKLTLKAYERDIIEFSSFIKQEYQCENILLIKRTHRDLLILFLLAVALLLESISIVPQLLSLYAPRMLESRNITP